MRQTQCCPSILMRFVLGRLNDLSERAALADGQQPAFEAARSALQAAGLAGRLYVRRPAPDAAAPRPRRRLIARRVDRPLAYGRA